MATTSTSAFANQTVTTTGTLKRTVSDKIRTLFPGSANVLAMVAPGSLGKSKALLKSEGLIGKKSTQNHKFESFTYTPLTITFTVSSVSGSDYTVSSATGLRPKYTLVNTANNTVARISAISSNTLTLTSFGATSFSASADDVLLALAPAYEENSSSPYILQKDEDNLYNYVQIVRFPVAISASSKGNPHYGGDFFSRIKLRNGAEALRKVDNTLIWSERASSGDTTTDSTLADVFRTTRGLWNWAQGSKTLGGALTHDYFMDDLVNVDMQDVVNDNTPLVMLTGRRVNGLMQSWIQQDLEVNQSKDEILARYGVKASVFTTSGPDIKVVKHDSFDRGSNVGKALIFNPEDCFYCYKMGRDLMPHNGIQSNSTDGYEDEIIGEIGIGVLDGGETITKLTGCL